MVFGASLQLHKMKGRFYNIALSHKKSGFSLFQLSSPFSYAMQLLLGKKTMCMPQRDKVENQQILQRIASECC